MYTYSIYINIILDVNLFKIYGGKMLNKHKLVTRFTEKVDNYYLFVIFFISVS